MAADTARRSEPCLLQAMQPKCYLYATFGAVPSRPSGLALELIIVLVLWRLGGSHSSWSSFVSVRPRLEGAIDFVSFVSRLFLAALAVSLLISDAKELAQ